MIDNIFFDGDGFESLNGARKTFFEFPVETSSVGFFGDDVERYWEDIVFHGDVHGHGPGQMMTYDGALGTILDYDGSYNGFAFWDESGHCVGFVVDCDPYEDVLDDFREQHPPMSALEEQENVHSDLEESHHSHSHASVGHHIIDGYSAVSSFDCGGRLLLGDPSFIHDGRVGEYIVLEPLLGDIVRLKVFFEGGTRKHIVAVFARR